jgi:hypothetical protein
MSLPWTIARCVGAACVTVAVGAAGAGAATVGPITQVSGGSPYTAGCSGHTEPGTNFLGAEVEPWIAVGPTGGLVGAWQQDRWSNGGAHGQLAAVSADGTSWTSSFADFNRCSLLAHGKSRDDASEPGHFWDRSTDPWVDVSPNGTIHQITDSLNVTGRGFGDGTAILYSRYDPTNNSWAKPTVLRQDLLNTALNDKQTLTADPLDSNFVYAIWDRLVSPAESANPIATENAIGYRGPTWFARSTDGGATWEPARIIFDPGEINQTIGSQIVVLPDGTLVDGFNLIFNFKNANAVRGDNVAIQRSTDHGATWGSPVIVDKLVETSVTAPGETARVRTGDILPDWAVDPTSGRLFAIWQDGRFKPGGLAGIALAWSDDGGLTWSDTIEVDDSGAGVAAFTPSIDVNSAGDVAITYYDFRNDAEAGGPATTDYRVAVWPHGAGGFGASQPVGGTFDHKNAPLTTRGWFLGDYEGLDHVGTVFRPFFARSPRATDIYTATVTP